MLTTTSENKLKLTATKPTATKFSVKDILELPTRHTREVSKMLGLNDFLSNALVSSYSSSQHYTSATTASDSLPNSGSSRPEHIYTHPYHQQDFLPFSVNHWPNDDSKSISGPYFSPTFAGTYMLYLIQ